MLVDAILDGEMDMTEKGKVEEGECYKEGVINGE